MNAVSPSAQQTSAFELLSCDSLESLNIDLFTYRHIKTGALHYHFASDNEENVFLAGFRTVPTDSTGVAHILEHTALCGSERFPVRDPFFMMLRRSLNTFMNAITSSDWTAYPFASANRKDFFNLLDVYLDAVFFSSLHPLDFAQEGHRLAFIDNDPEKPLEYRGVVFNEMKGAMSSVQSVLWHSITEHVFSNNTYHYNSGGNPADIPSLSYEDLQAFYKKHYHPSNAMLMTFGNIDVSELQNRFEERALQHFEKNDAGIQVELEPKLSEPKAVSAPYAASSEEDKSHVTISWLLDESTDIEAYLKANVLEGILLDNSASPLRKMLETSDLGNSPSSMCGLEDTNRQMMFVAGLEGCSQDNAEAIEAQILECLHNIAENGVPQADIDAVLHQLELHQREITGDGYPYGLQLIMQSLSAAVHRGNPANVLDIDKALNALREQSQQPGFVQGLVKELLLDNTHRVRLCLYPDLNLAEQEKQAEQDTLAEVKAALTPEQIDEIVSLNTALDERQSQPDDPSLLPKVGIEDIPKDIKHFTAEKLGSTPLINRFDAATNGLVYQQAIINLAALSEEQRELLPFYCRCLSEVGIADADYLSVQQRQAANVGHIYSYFGLQNVRGSNDKQISYLTLDAKALNRNAEQQTQLMIDTLNGANFSNTQRVKELLQQYITQKIQGVVGSGHSFAMQAASANFSAVNRLEYQTTGMAGISKLKTLLSAVESEEAMQSLCSQLQTLHDDINGLPIQIVQIAEPNCGQTPAATWPNNEGDFNQTFELAKNTAVENISWAINSQVSFCAMAFPTVASGHEDSAALAILGGILRNGYLHTAIREKGGAYGGGASHDSSNGVFRFYSYRDPRLEATFEDFKASINWLINEDIEERLLEESILGVVSSLDKPGSPAGECKKSFNHDLYGRTLEQRLQFRENVVKTTMEDIKAVAQKYLTGDAAYAVLAGQTQLDEARDFLASLNVQQHTL